MVGLRFSREAQRLFPQVGAEIADQIGEGKYKKQVSVYEETAANA